MPSIGIMASQISGHLAVYAYDSIATTTLATTATTVTFSSIPSTYTHLQLRILARSNRGAGSGAQLTYQFNSDTGTNYDDHYLSGDGATATAGNDGTSQTYIWGTLIPVASTTANAFGVSVVDILDYANTNKNKTTRGLGGFDSNGGGWIYLNSGLWRSTTAINSISIICSASASFIANSSFALYGIKGA